MPTCWCRKSLSVLDVKALSYKVTKDNNVQSNKKQLREKWLAVVVTGREGESVAALESSP